MLNPVSSWIFIKSSDKLRRRIMKTADMHGLKGTRASPARTQTKASELLLMISVDGISIDTHLLVHRYVTRAIGYRFRALTDRWGSSCGRR